MDLHHMYLNEEDKVNDIDEKISDLAGNCTQDQLVINLTKSIFV